MQLKSQFGRLLCAASVICGTNQAAAAGGGWMRVAGGAQGEYTYHIEQTSDGGHVAAGLTYTYGAGSGDGVCIKLDRNGDVSWQSVLGGTAFDLLASVLETTDGGYVLVGDTGSAGAGGTDGWCVKLDGAGNVVWSRTYGGSAYDSLSSVVATADGGYVVAGYTASYGAGQFDAWCMKLDAGGSPVWQKTYGGALLEYLRDILKTADGGYLLAGSTQSFGEANGDGWCVKLDSGGNPSWQRSIGTSGAERIAAVCQAVDGGYVFAGDSKTGGDFDGWSLKLNSAGGTVWSRTYSGGADETLWGISPAAGGGYVVGGTTTSAGAGGFDACGLGLDASGIPVWGRTYGGAGDESFQWVRQTTGGGLVFCGGAGSFGAGGSDYLFVKTSTASSGDIDASCGTYVQAWIPAVATPAMSSADTSAAAQNISVITSAWGCSVTAPWSPGTVICASPAAPDLTATWTKLKSKGSRVRGTLTCVNAGTADAGMFFIEVHVSKKPAVGPKSTKIMTFTLPSLAAGAQSVLKISGPKLSSHKYAVATIDSDHHVTEADEGNNVIAGKL